MRCAEWSGDERDSGRECVVEIGTERPGFYLRLRYFAIAPSRRDAANAIIGSFQVNDPDRK
jgi:hypothetical protein